MALLLSALFGACAEEPRNTCDVDVIGRWVHDEATLVHLERRVENLDLPFPDSLGLALWAQRARTMPPHLLLPHRRRARQAWRNEVWEVREDGVLAITTHPFSDPVPGSGVFHFCEMGRWEIHRDPDRLTFQLENGVSGTLEIVGGRLRRSLAPLEGMAVLVREVRSPERRGDGEAALCRD